MHWVERMRSRFGIEMINVLEGTQLEEHANENHYGIFVIRAAVEPSRLAQWTGLMDAMFVDVPNSLGSNSTKVKSRGATMSHYNTIQAVVGDCSCKYSYEGTARHPLFHLPDPKCRVLSDALEWAHDGDQNELFNELVANAYDPQMPNSRGCIPWHTDDNKFIGDNPTILSVTTHSPGAFCFAPLKGSGFAHNWHAAKEEKRKQLQIAAGVRGVLPLFPGDLMGMWGSAQKHLQHKTLPPNRITSEVLANYPAVNNSIRASVDLLQAWINQHGLQKRCVITFRRIITASLPLVAFRYRSGHGPANECHHACISVFGAVAVASRSTSAY